MDYNEIARKTEELEILFKCREHKAEVLDLTGVYGTEATVDRNLQKSTSGRI